MSPADAVTLAYVHDREVTHSFHDSLTNLLFFDASHHGRIMRGGYHKMRCGTGGLVRARNMVAERFLEDDDAEWLFWLDTDMGFEPDTLERLLEAADPAERPIVGGLCFAQFEAGLDGSGGFLTRARPTISDWVEREDTRGFVGRAWFPPNTVTRCDGTGSACLVIHRSVFEKINEKYGPVWYDQARGDQGLVAEDLSFCMRAATVDAPVHVHTGVKATHMKTVWLSDREFWEQQTAPPATDRVAVLVPVMRRPQNAEPFMRSLTASTGLATVYAIHDEDDIETRDAWKRAGAHVIQSSGPTFAVKVNDGYRATSEPWCFLVGDDVRFLPGWYDHARLAADVTKAAVVGTNDLGNPRVMRGEHATHMLVRRSYVDEVGFWDGPGLICHESYSHWYVDDELVAAARQAGVWAMALASKVEHLHPIFGKGTTDAVYELGQARQEQDRKVFEARAEKFA